MTDAAQQIREAFEELYLRATEKQAWLEELRDAHEAALDRLVAERDEARRKEADAKEKWLRWQQQCMAAEGREAALREALTEYQRLTAALAYCADECGEALLLSDLKAADERAVAALAAVPAAEAKP